MAENTEHLENQDPIDENLPEAPAPEEEKPQFTQAEVEKLLAGRASKYKREQAELQAEVEELRKKVRAGTANVSEINQHQAIQQNAQMAQNQGLSHADVARIQQETLLHEQLKQKHMSFAEQLQKAAKEDPEFDKLAGITNGQQTADNFIPPQAMDEFYHLDNAPAVLKHLKKNKKDYAVVTSMGSRAERIKFINDLSDKLEKQVKVPAPSDYTPEPDLSDIGNSTQDGFDAVKYMKGKF